MKSKLPYVILLTLFGYLAILGSSSGPTGMIGDRTGSPISNGLCNGCHSSPGTFDPTITISLRDSSNSLITNGTYKPGYTYNLRIDIFSPPSMDVVPIIPQYGLQAVILTGNNTQAGVLSNPTTDSSGLGTGARLYYLSAGRAYLEHNQRSIQGIFNAQWQAPIVGTGAVTVYSAGEAVNANTAFTGDNLTNTYLTLTEDLSIGIDKIQFNLLQYKTYPSPFTNDFYIEGIEGESIITIYDMRGQKVFQKKTRLETIAHKISLEVPTGIYTLRIQQGNKTGTKQIISGR
jgi:hypothetical protein